MILFGIGDTTFASDPTGRRKSYTVYTTATGKKFYTRIDGRWFYAYPVPPTGFRVGKRVPKNVAGHLSGSRRS